MEKMTLQEFLESRQLPSEILEYFEEQHIDCSTILIMPEEDLKKIVPKYGDRVALRDFCKKRGSTSKYSLLEKLREKLQRKEKGQIDETKSSITGRKKKQNRIIEIGWFCENKKEKRFRQVRVNKGGGTRKVTVPKTLKCCEILPTAKELFFPAGISCKGPISNFECELWDYKSHKINEDMTVEEIYELSALNVLRFYLSTRYKADLDEEGDDEDFIPSTVTTVTENSETAAPLSHRDIFSDALSHSSADAESFFFEFSACNSLVSGMDDDITILELPEIISPVVSGTETTTILPLHRSKIFSELLTAFKIPNFSFSCVTIEMVFPNGERERAQDGGGVLRDVLSEFWTQFYETCTVGTSFKVPYIRHDFGEVEWEAVARIFASGWRLKKYFPIRMAPTFMKNCLQQEIKDDELMEDFLLFVSELESDLLKQALVDFDSIDQEEIIDLFSSYDSKWLPSSDNLKKLIIDVAHQELVQKPAFVSQCFKKEFSFLDIHLNVPEMYKACNIMPRNILANLKFQDELPAEHIKTISYLKKFIRESDIKTRAAFLRFCTGADIVTDVITVNFNVSEGFLRRPVAHTCSRVLELPTTHQSFLEFRTEWNNILNSNIWVMDII